MCGRSLCFYVLGCILIVPSYGVSGQHESLAAKSEQAKELIAAGRPKAAIPIYEELIHAVPGNPGLLMDLGIAFDRAGEDQRAIQEFKAALKLKPDDATTALLLALAYLNLNQPGRAVPLLNRVVAAQPHNEMARLKLGEGFFALGKDAQAAVQFREVCFLNPQNAKAWYELGRCYDALSRDLFLSLRRMAPTSGYFLALLASASAKQRQYGAALELYRKASLKLPQMRELYAAEAAIYQQTGHADWATAVKQKGYSLPPPDCSVQPLACDFQAGKYDDVVQKAAATTRPEAYYWEVRAYDRMAIRAYLHLTRLPPSAQLYEVTAQIDVARGDFPKAVQDLQQARRLSPLDPDVEKNLAVAYRRVGMQGDARTLLKHLVQAEPDSSEANYLFGDTLLSLLQPRQAIPYLRRSLALNPAFLPAQRSLGNAYMQAGNPVAAIPCLTAALPIDKDGAIHYQLARAYQETGKTALAKKLIRQYKEIQAQNSPSPAPPSRLPPP